MENAIPNHTMHAKLMTKSVLKFHKSPKASQAPAPGAIGEVCAQRGGR
jgi:hypothetical protein